MDTRLGWVSEHERPGNRGEQRWHPSCCDNCEAQSHPVCCGRISRRNPLRELPTCGVHLRKNLWRKLSGINGEHWLLRVVFFRLGPIEGLSAKRNNADSNIRRAQIRRSLVRESIGSALPSYTAEAIRCLVSILPGAIQIYQNPRQNRLLQTLSGGLVWRNLLRSQGLAKFWLIEFGLQVRLLMVQQDTGR